jgi:hypothetical protein
MLRSIMLAAALLAASAPARAQGLFDGTPQDRAACRPDALKFCKDVLGDKFLVLDCLREKQDQISRACYAVLEKYGQLP